MPPEIWDLIFRYMKLRDLKNIILVCRLFYVLALPIFRRKESIFKIEEFWRKYGGRVRIPSKLREQTKHLIEWDAESRCLPVMKHMKALIVMENLEERELTYFDESKNEFRIPHYDLVECNVETIYPINNMYIQRTGDILKFFEVRSMIPEPIVVKVTGPHPVMEKNKFKFPNISNTIRFFGYEKVYCKINLNLILTGYQGITVHIYSKSGGPYQILWRYIFLTSKSREFLSDNNLEFFSNLTSFIVPSYVRQNYLETCFEF